MRVALQKLGHQLYGRTVFYGTVKRFDDSATENTSEYYTTLASSEDIDEFFSNVNSESNDGKYQLLVRRWYHERRFGDCYVTKVKGTDEICAANWVVTKKHLEEMGWEGRYPNFTVKDVLRENTYVLEKFRRMGVQQSGSLCMDIICLEMGFTHGKDSVAENNTPALLSNLKNNWLAYEKVVERHLLFQVTRKIIETYDPPIPIPILQENQ
ncbi:MAG: hypothetical protein JSV77_02345 [Dehalococcoidales bacterium]|nr:MAG: hypothetical protein JSV77_02345 [Dehalococcoidales bacterium]